ncbi:hypothetical protein OH77DRAFT_1097543 [Trametes cingulata]|nr:hypothetical protein OH77DRAFT_1097543 [Trametes cingulata]
MTHFDSSRMRIGDSDFASPTVLRVDVHISHWAASVLSQTLQHTSLKCINLSISNVPLGQHGNVVTAILLALTSHPGVVAAVSRVRYFVCDLASDLDRHSDFGLWTRDLRVRTAGSQTGLSMKLRGRLEEMCLIPYDFLRHSTVVVLGGTGWTLEDDLGVTVYDPLVIDTVLEVPSSSESEEEHHWQPEDAGDCDREQGPGVTHYYYGKGIPPEERGSGSGAGRVDPYAARYYDDKISMPLSLPEA